MACAHASCQCAIVGCGVDHPRGWKPAMTISINGVATGGDDAADCMAHYLLGLGYPRDNPARLRGIAELQAARWEERRP